MENGENRPRRGRLRTVLMAFGATLCWVSATSAQHTADPVEELRLVLKTTGRDCEARERRSKNAIQALHSASDLRRALVLQDWRDEDVDTKVAAIDLSNRAAVAQLFEEKVRRVLRQGDPTSRLAVLNMLAELGVTARAVGSKKSLAGSFGLDLVELIKQGDPGVCEAAARTLGQINPDPDVAVEALSGMLGAAEPTQRLAAADGLVALVRVTAQLAGQKNHLTPVEPTRREVVKMACAVVSVTGRGLRHEQAEIRRRGVEAIDYAAQALRKLVSSASSAIELEEGANFRQQLAQERAQLLPLIVALKDQGPSLTRALSDGDAEVRLLARRALEDMTNIQLHLLERMTGIATQQQNPPPGRLPASNFVLTSTPSNDPLLEGLQGTALALAAALGEKDARGRRAAIDVLETLGPAAAPAATALVAALADADPFVRWSAARTLGKISPVEADTTVPGLAKLLGDLDLDVRLAGAIALERYGLSANAAVPDLMRATRSSDAVMRVATIRALGAVGSREAHAAVPSLIKALSDSDISVRQTAAAVLGKFGPAARDAVDGLRKALNDVSPDVQQAAGDALLNIMQPPKQ